MSHGWHSGLSLPFGMFMFLNDPDDLHKRKDVLYFDWIATWLLELGYDVVDEWMDEYVSPARFPSAPEICCPVRSST
jgi:hypothetical protein